jgi:hypothetical protein
VGRPVNFFGILMETFPEDNQFPSNKIDFAALPDSGN